MGTPIEPEDFAGPFDELLAGILDSTSTLFRSLRARATEKWRGRAFHIFFTDGAMLSARYHRCPDVDYIIVPVGALEKIGGTAYGIMAEPSFCPRIGNASLEAGMDTELPKGFPSLPMLRNDHDPDHKISVLLPTCRIRSAYAQHLMVSAVHFIIMHEMGHVFGGHLDSRFIGDDEHADISFASVSNVNSKDIPPYVVELDADMFAAHHHSLFEMSDGLRASINGLFPWRGMPESEAAFATMANTIGILFRVAEKKSWTFPESMRDYPAPVLRTLFSLGTMASCCINADLLKMTSGPKIVNKTIRDIDRIWQIYKLPGHLRGDDTRDWVNNLTNLSAQLNREYELYKSALANGARLEPLWQQGYWGGSAAPES